MISFQAEYVTCFKMKPLNFFLAKEAINYSNLTFREAEKSKHKSKIITFNLRHGITVGGGKED